MIFFIRNKNFIKEFKTLCRTGDKDHRLLLFLFLTCLVPLSLARQCAQLWIKTRESLGHPLGIVSEPAHLVCPKELVEAAAKKVRIFIYRLLTVHCITCYLVLFLSIFILKSNSVSMMYTVLKVLNILGLLS